MDERPAAHPTPASFGAVENDGTVYLRMPDGTRRAVGQYAAGQPGEALALYTRRYLDLITEVDLAATRLANDRMTPAQATATVARIREALAAPTFVGDLAALVSRVGQLEVLVNVKRAALAEQRERAKQDALGARERLAEEAERLADSESWRQTGDRFAQLVDEWKAVPQVDRAKEQEFWKRISASRAKFDRRRKAHFHQLETERGEAKAEKEVLIKEAAKLSGSRDWEATARAYRKLMDRWKKAGRAGKADDALWERFRAAQDGFFAARQEILDRQSTDEREALAIKERLLTDAEKLLPIKDLRAAKRELRLIQGKWDKAGRVPRGDVKAIEARLRAVEDAVRAAEQERWKRANPELRGRASDTVTAFQAKIDKLEIQLERARAANDDTEASRIEEELAGARMLLDAAEKGLARFS